MKSSCAKLLFTSILSLTVVPRVFADGLNGPHMGQNWGWGHMFYGGPMMLIFWLLILVFTVIVVRWIVGALMGNQAKQADTSALQILAERYARGDIDKDEFNERKREITT